jgi:hypothetical protein
MREKTRYPWENNMSQCCKLNDLQSEWVSDCCLTLEKNYSAMPWGEQITFQWYSDDETLFVIDQHA